MKMAQQVVAEQVRQLRRSMNDLVSLAALPAIWVGRDAAYVVNTLLDALAGILDADFVCIRLNQPSAAHTAVRVGSAMRHAPAEILELLSSALGEDHASWPVSGEIDIDGEALAIAAAPMGLEGEIGIVVAGSRRAAFADEAERLVLSVAANQAALALQGVRRFDEQRQIASGLDERVARRTAELAAANEALRLEVAERQRTEEALRFSERQAREIIDGIPTLAGLLRPDGQVEQVNRRIHEFTGRSREELEQWGMSDLIHPDDRAAAIDSFLAGFAAGVPFEIVYRMRRHDGIYRWFEGLHSPLKDSSGAIIRWCVACNDIEDRKQVEDALRETERAWRSVINGIPGLTATLSPVGMVEAVNQQIIDYTGCELEELRGWGTNGIVHPDDMPRVAEIFGGAIASGTPYEIEQRLRRFDGVYRWFSNRGTPAFDASGNILRWYVLLVDIEEARQVADALRASDENARFIVDTIAGMVAIFAPDGQLSGSNQQLLDYFQQPLEEVANWATNGMTHPDDLQHCIDTFMGSIGTGEPYDFETRFKGFDGVFRWFQISGRPLRDATGNIVRWYGLLTDIDDRKHAEAALLRREHEARQVVDTIPGLIVSFSPGGATEGCNRQLLEYMGQTYDEFLSWASNGTVHDDDLGYALQMFGASLASGADYDFELRLRRFDGKWRWFNVRGRASRDATGQIERWYGLLTDIDDQKGVEVALAASEREMRMMLDSLSAGIVTLAPDGKIIGANRQFLDYFGGTTDDLQRWGSIDLVHPDDLARVKQRFQDWLASGEPASWVYRMRRFDGVYRWYQVTNTPLRDEAGHIVRWYGLLIDVDDQKSVEVALAESEREIRAMLDSIGVGVGIISPDAKVIGATRHMLEYFGITLEELQQWGSNSVIHPDDLPGYKEYFRKWMASPEQPPVASLRLRRHDGVYRWHHSTNTAHKDENGKILRWYGVTMDVDDQKRAEEAVAASELELRLMLDSIAAGVMVFDPSGELISVNRQLLEYFGTSLEEVQQWSNNALIHPDDLAEVREFFADWLNKGDRGTVVGRIRRFDGVYRWFQATNTVLRNEAGEIIRWYALLADIDDQKRAEEALAASERKLQLTVDTIPALVWSARTDGTADFFNRHYLDYVGKTPEELSGWAWTEAVHPDDIPKLGAAWAHARETGGGTECEARMRNANGTYRWFIFRAHPLRNEAGEVVKWYGINTDIEDRKVAEEELKRSEASLAEAQRMSALGSFNWYLDTGEIEFSDELYRMFEFERPDPITIERIAERVHPDDIALLTEKVGLAMRGINDHEYEVRARMLDGRIKYLRTASRSAVEAGGAHVFRGSIQDVTSQKLAEEALNELRSELAHVSRVSTLGAMTASIAHEVNQPLAGIITNASTCLRMLAAEPPNIDGARETARRTIRDGNRAAEVVTRLRAMFRKRSETTDTVDMNEAARDVIALASSELRRSRVELEINLAAELPSIAGDRIQLQQVILNLLLNAADAVRDVEDRPRRAVLRTNEDEDGNVRLTVQDTGVGIDPQSSARLFDAFYTTKSSGMGIGLSISRSIIEHHGGRIWASANDGPGASFSFAIPRTPNQYSKGAAGALADSAPHPTGKTND